MWATYVTWEPRSGRFYIGKTKQLYLDAGYQGSGVWVRAALRAGRKLITQQLTWEPTEQDALDTEVFFVSVFRSDPLCKNIADGGRGFTSEEGTAWAKEAWSNPNYRIKMLANVAATQPKLQAGAANWRGSEGGIKTMKLNAQKALVTIKADPVKRKAQADRAVQTLAAWRNSDKSAEAKKLASQRMLAYNKAHREEISKRMKDRNPMKDRNHGQRN